MPKGTLIFENGEAVPVTYSLEHMITGELITFGRIENPAADAEWLGLRAELRLQDNRRLQIVFNDATSFVAFSRGRGNDRSEPFVGAVRRCT